MAGLGVKKGRNKKRKQDSLSTTIKALPRELLVEIMAKVASASVLDLCKVKLSCREFLHAAEDDYVYQHASMDKFALVPLPWFTRERETSFLKRCRESGNSEISYREGMVEYFSSLRVESGLQKLKKAAMEGHEDSKYVHCMLLMSSEYEQERKHGFDLFCSLKKTTCVKRCRKRVNSFIGSLWVHNPVVVPRNWDSLCHSSTCGDSGKLHNVSTKRPSLLDEDEDYGTIGSCEHCHGDYELSLFFKMFKIV